MASFEKISITETNLYNYNLGNSIIEAECLTNKKNKELLHKLLLINKKNNEQGTSSTKTRSEVRGGGRKPWRQKGTGRARAGSNRSPLWRGGGVIFGPKPKLSSSKNLKSNKKEKFLALLSLIYQKRQNLIISEDPYFYMGFQKTKSLKNFLDNLAIKNDYKKNNHYLFIVDYDEMYKKLKRISKNLKNVNIIQFSNLNPFVFLKENQTVFISAKQLEYIGELGRKYE